MLDILRCKSVTLDDILNEVDGIFYRCNYDRDWTMTFISGGCKKLTGYEKDDLLYNKTISFGQIIHPEDAGPIYRQCSRSLERKEPCNIGYRIITREGIIKNVTERSSGIYDENGNLTHIEGYIKDVSEDASRNNTLLDLLAFQQAVNTNIIMSVTDRKGTIISVNERFCEISKYTEKELIGENHRIINSGLHQKEFFRELWATIKTGKRWRGIIRNKAKDGSHYWVDTVIVPVLNDHKEVEKFLSLRLDITKQIEAEIQKDRYIKSLEELMFIASHKIRQPVSSIQGLAYLLEKDLVSMEELKEVTGYLKRSIESIDNFTRELTDFIYQTKQNLDGRTRENSPKPLSG